MSRTNLIQKILEILDRNVETNIQHTFVEYIRIAKKLNLPLPETKHMLKIVHDMDIIESNIETEYSLRHNG